MSKHAWHRSAETPLIIGHRGASAYAPENTLKAFKLAQAQGADGIEFDVQLSADNIPVVIHDHTLDRTTSGTGPINALSAAELGQLDAGDGESVPTLDQLFETCGPDFLYNVEIKTYGWRDVGAERAIADVIAAHGIADRIVVSSFDAWVMHRARRAMPHMLHAQLWVPKQAHVRLLFSGQAEHPHFSAITPELMAAARSADRRINVWTLDDPDIAQHQAQLGVNAIVTNKPDIMVAALR